MSQGFRRRYLLPILIERVKERIRLLDYGEMTKYRESIHQKDAAKRMNVGIMINTIVLLSPLSLRRKQRRKRKPRDWILRGAEHGCTLAHCKRNALGGLNTNGVALVAAKFRNVDAFFRPAPYTS